MANTPEPIHSIRRLLQRSIPPVVEVASSHIEGAGIGVFTSTPISRHTPLCLYPGVFSPGLPSGLHDAVYLGMESLPSRVIPTETNAYIMNLKSIGGYIDGMATQSLLENPSACAHLVNHSENANVEVISFWWSDVLDEIADTDMMGMYDIPNSSRSDNTPWFYFDNRIEYYSGKTRCAGAVFCALSDIQQNEELYLDYGLKNPLPPWAEGWYND